MWEESLVNLEQRLFVVHKQVQQVVLVLRCEICNSHPVFAQLSQPQKRFLKLAGFVRTAVEGLELLAVVNLVFQPPLHHFLAHLLDAVNEEAFELAAFGRLVACAGNGLPLGFLLPVANEPQVGNRIGVAGLEGLNVLDDLVLDIDSGHPALEDKVNELLKLGVASRNVLVTARRTPSRCPLWSPLGAGDFTVEEAGACNCVRVKLTVDHRADHWIFVLNSDALNVLPLDVRLKGQHRVFFRLQVLTGRARLSDEGVVQAGVSNNFIFGVHLLLESANGQLEQLVLALAINDLVLEEVLVLLIGIGPGTKELNAFLQLAFLVLHLGLLVSQLLHGLKLLLNNRVFQTGVAVLVVELGDELAEFALLLFDVETVALQVVVLLLLEHAVQLHVQIRDHFFQLLSHLLHFVMPFVQHLVRHVVVVVAHVRPAQLQRGSLTVSCSYLWGSVRYSFIYN